MRSKARRWWEMCDSVLKPNPFNTVDLRKVADYHNGGLLAAAAIAESAA